MTSAGSTSNNSHDAQQQQNQQDNLPRDVKLLHLLFAAKSIHSYEEHVPLQLMDFAYRYTTGVLKDAVIYNDHGSLVKENTKNIALNNHIGVGHNSSITSNAESAGLTVDDIKLAIAARTEYQFRDSQSKELLYELANERNRKPLPGVVPTYGIRLPPEKYCFTGRKLELEDEFKYESEAKRRKN